MYLVMLRFRDAKQSVNSMHERFKDDHICRARGVGVVVMRYVQSSPLVFLIFKTFISIASHHVVMV